MKQFHVSFKKWIDEKFGEDINRENVMQLDKQYEYGLFNEFTSQHSNSAYEPGDNETNNGSPSGFQSD